MKVDNFSLIGKIIWYSIFGIGYLMLYMAYFFPTEWGKKRNTSITSRQLRHKHLWGPINAIVVLSLLFGFLFLEQIKIILGWDIMGIILLLVKIITSISFLILILCMYFDAYNRNAGINFGIFLLGLFLLWVL